MKYIIFPCILFFSSLTYSAPTQVGQFTFDGGYVLNKAETDLNPNESRDMCNCVVDSDGGLTKRNGSTKFVEQALSSNPFVFIYRYYTPSKKTLIGVNENKIVASTGGVFPIWSVLTSTITKGDHWNWVTMNNYAIGVSPNNPIKKYDLAGDFSDLLSEVVSTEAMKIKAKYNLMVKNYFIVGNVTVSTSINYETVLSTSYDSRIYYSLLLSPSSMTWNRYIEYRTDNGEGITGIGDQFDAVHLFKPSSIGELTFTILNLPSKSGDWALQEIVSDFGLYAPRTLQKRGGYYILGTKSEVRVWDGGRHSRATAGEETTVISRDIQPLIERLIRSGTWKNAVGKYIPRKDWYILSYEDTDKFPKGVNNSAIFYDFKIGKWFPICNWNIESMETFDGSGDYGEFYFGSSDGYVYKGDDYLSPSADDTKKEKIVDMMNSSISWVGSTRESDKVEGDYALKISVDTTTTISSMTRMGILQWAEWDDKTRVSKSDKLTFKIKPSGLSNLTKLRVDLDIDDISDTPSVFSNNFTSVTFTSASFTGDGVWQTLSVSFDTFTIRDDWVDLAYSSFPFANTLNFYGMRFHLEGIDVSSVIVDDIRIVSEKPYPVKMSWKSKLFNFESIDQKNFGQVVLVYEKTPESNLKIDLFNNFGDKIRSDEFKRDIEKEFFVTGILSTSAIISMSSVDFEILRSTIMDKGEFISVNGSANKDYIILTDRKGIRLMKVDRDDFNSVISTYGSLGNGTTNFNVPHSISLKENSIFMTDFANNRIKEHSLKDLSFVQEFGNLGTEATSFIAPTGICVNTNDINVIDEGNSVIKTLSISTMGFKYESQTDFNKTGDASIVEDENYRYILYEKNNNTTLGYVDLILEKRLKPNNELVNRINIYKNNSVVSSTYAIKGDIALIGNYLFISFTDDFYNSARSYFIQKRLRNDLSFLDEYSTTKRIFSLIGYSNSYLPYKKVERKDLKMEGTYFQIKYYDEENDNHIKLFNQTLLLDAQSKSY